MKTQAKKERPSVQVLEAELRRVRYQRKYRAMLKNTVTTLIAITAVAVLAATAWLPLLRIYGNSMSPTLADGDILFSVKAAALEPGDIAAFYYNDKILVKRVIAQSGDMVDIDENGTVSINGTALDEPYISEASLGAADITLPYQVPEGRYFVMGDHRATSVDSRNTALGCVAEEQIIGKILFRIWPLSRFGWISEK